MASDSKLTRLLRDPGRVLSSRLLIHLLPRLTPHAEARRIGLWNFGKLPRRALEDLFPEVRDVDISVVGPYNRKLDMSMDMAEVVAIASLLKARGARRIAEIGTYDGNTTVNIAANASEDARITTIDLPADWNGEYQVLVPDEHRNASDSSIVGRQFAGTPHAARITQVLGDSMKLDWSTLDGPFDAVFIDGCHFYDFVKKDTENAIAHLAPGGLILWHDYGYIEDVSRAVDEFGDRLEMAVISGTRLAVGWPRRKTAAGASVSLVFNLFHFGLSLAAYQVPIG